MNLYLHQIRDTKTHIMPIPKVMTKKQSKKNAKKWAQREITANAKPTMAHEDFVEYTKGAAKRDLDFVRNVKL